MTVTTDFDEYSDDMLFTNVLPDELLPVEMLPEDVPNVGVSTTTMVLSPVSAGSKVVVVVILPE